MAPCTEGPLSTVRPTWTTGYNSTEGFTTTEGSFSPSVPPTNSTEWTFDNWTQRVIIASLACVISAVGIPGNLLVIFAVTFSKRLQTKTNFLVVNLACGDLLTCLIIPFQVYCLLQDTSPYPDYFCQGLATLFWLGLGGSVITLALIALIRYYIITKPRQMYETVFRRRHIFLMVFTAWVIPLLLILVPPMVGVGEIGYSTRYRICATNNLNEKSDIYSLIAGLSVEVPCLLVIVVCYARIYLFIRQVSIDVILSARSDPNQVNRVRGIPRTTLEIAVFRRQIKVAQNLFLVTCAYIICVMPFSIMCTIPGTTYPVLPWTFLFGFLNCCINPFIYALKHPQFQEVLWLIAYPGKRKKPANCATSVKNGNTDHVPRMTSGGNDSSDRAHLLTAGRADTGNMCLNDD